MNASLFMPRTGFFSSLWPRLRLQRSHHDDHACAPARAQRRFVPMAILLDETQAYKPASHACHQTPR